MPKVRTMLILAIAVLTASACGELDGGGGGTGGAEPIDHPTGADELILRWEQTGGFVPYEYELRRIPGWSLYGDGTLVVPGPMIEIYPPPAWPALVGTSITEDGVQAILQAAQAAGLMDGDASYDYACITDMPTTVFTTVALGTTSVVSAYALSANGSCPDVDEEARATLAGFQTKLGDLASWLPEGSIGPEVPFDARELRVYAMPYEGDPELPQEPVGWPLPTPLSKLGEEVPGAAQGLRCGVVSGGDLDTLRTLAESTNELTPWVSADAAYRLLLRPLLPDEHGC